jgi:hypothetical protein
MIHDTLSSTKGENRVDLGSALVDAIVPRLSCLGRMAHQEVRTFVAVGTAASGVGMPLHCSMDTLQAY